MFVAVGGVPRVGKSNMAIAVARRAEALLMPTDVLIEAFLAANPGGAINYQNTPAREQAVAGPLAAAMKQLQSLTERCVVEGELLTPALVHTLQQTLEVTPVFLGMSKADRRVVAENEGRNSWFQHLPADRQRRTIEAIRQRSRTLYDECGLYGYDYVDLSSEGYSLAVERLVTTYACAFK